MRLSHLLIGTLAVYVTVANPHGIRHGARYWGVGARCLLTSTKYVSTHDSPRGIRSYRIEEVRGPVPATACPPGTVFLVPQATMEQWQQEDAAGR